MRSTTQTSFALLFQVFIVSFSYAADTISFSSGEAFTYPQTLISNNEEFQFGQMDPGNNTDTYYMGIWYNRVPLLETTRVWVANRDAPFYLFNSELKLLEDGNLVLVENSTTIWSANLTSSNTQNSIEAVLLDDGNFVLRSLVPPFQVLWQSFDNPTDTLLPGGRIGYDKRTNKSQVLTSWKQAADPAKGVFTLELDPSEHQLLLKNGSQTDWSSGPWDGQSFTHATELNDFINFRYVENENESYITYNVSDSSILYRFIMELSGQFTLFSFDDELQDWTSLWSQTTTSGGNNNGSTTWIIVGVGVVAAVIILGLAVICIVFKKRQIRKGGSGKINLNNENTTEDLELPLFDLDTIITATNRFSRSNKIGEGGFGPVYKGILPTGDEIAIKRLSKHSKQGIEEFMNEVILIAKLQHRNLVGLFGCCIHGEEKMLIYEYMPNGSLDTLIFDKKRSIDLNWGLRYNIIVGIARGLLYLHRDSRLTIIHRDLKAGNILLDSNMNPKISDFGMAKTFRGDQTEQNTIRVVGTYGYMSPEYAIDGLFSMKSDVFSFGVLILEIISGKRNRGFHHASHDFNLLGHTWKLFMDNKELELMDDSIKQSYSALEVLTCIQIGLLCVQKFPEDRPTMESVVSMLETNGAVLPYPKQPGFYTERSPLDITSSQIPDIFYTVNVITDTSLDGR